MLFPLVQEVYSGCCTVAAHGCRACSPELIWVGVNDFDPSILEIRNLELPPIGWQYFVLDSSQGGSVAFPSFLDTYATQLLAHFLLVSCVAGERIEEQC
jgi:hypothetical protein